MPLPSTWRVVGAPAAEERLEDARQFVVGDAGAVVLDFDHHLAAAIGRAR